MLLKLLLAGLVSLALLFPAVIAAASTAEGRVAILVERKLTITAKDGDTRQFDVAANAKIVLNGKPAQLRDIEIGDVVLVTFTSSGASKTATAIAARDAE
ncbi:MAG: hypothetical protein JSS27_02870 [Planctomycetes bacterium]|nr:hypothetical protein [Planctomycetota bacterium]